MIRFFHQWILFSSKMTRFENIFICIYFLPFRWLICMAAVLLASINIAIFYWFFLFVCFLSQILALAQPQFAHQQMICLDLANWFSLWWAPSLDFVYKGSSLLTLCSELNEVQVDSIYKNNLNTRVIGLISLRHFWLINQTIIFAFVMVKISVLLTKVLKVNL